MHAYKSTTNFQQLLNSMAGLQVSVYKMHQYIKSQSLKHTNTVDHKIKGKMIGGWSCDRFHAVFKTSHLQEPTAWVQCKCCCVRKTYSDQ